MLSSAISYASSKEKKRGMEDRREEGSRGGGGGLCGRENGIEWGKASEANQWTAVGQAVDAAWEQRD